MSLEEGFEEIEDPVIHQQSEIQVFPNQDGGITIRQISPYPHENMVVSFRVEHCAKIIGAIRKAKNEIMGL